jgi:phage gp36-like protein
VAEARQLGLSGRAFADTDAADFLANIASASDYASSFLANQYKLPLLAWGDDVKGAVSRIAAYEFLSVRGLNPDNGGADKNVKDRADAARKWFELVGVGKATPVGIQDSTPNQQPGTPGFQPAIVSSSQRGWTVDRNSAFGPRGPFVAD